MESSCPIVGYDNDGNPIIEAYGTQWPLMSDVALELACYRQNRQPKDGGLGAYRHLMNAHMLIWPHMNKSINEWMVRRFQVFCDRPKVLGMAGGSGCGKAQPLDSKILTPNGWITMGEAKIGDEVCTPDGATAKIIAIHPQGEKEIYKVTLDDGTHTLCTLDHLWLTGTVNERRRKKHYSVKTTKNILETIHHCGKINHFLPIIKPHRANVTNLELPPYLLGVYLGDGDTRNLRTTRVTINKEDLDIVDNINKVWGHGISFYKHSNPGTKTLYIKKAYRHIKSLGLATLKSIEKYIPEKYLYSDATSRYQLFLGLMDTDGTYGGAGNVSYSTSSKRLAEDMQNLCMSLGLTVYIGKKNPFFTHNGEKRIGHPSYRLNIKVPKGFIPFSTKRKLARFIPRLGKYNLKRQITSIEYHSIQEAKCITIDKPNGLYITDNYIVTHNSCDAARLALLDWWSLPSETTVLVCSTTIPALLQRIWSYLTEYKATTFIPMPGHISTSPSPRIMFDRLDTKHCIQGVALKEGATDRTLSNVIGIHPKRKLLVVVDEATDVTPAIMDAITNWDSGGVEFQMMVIGNSKSKLDTHGLLCEPKNGWGSVDPDIDTEWDTKLGKCLFFDCYRSPAITHPTNTALKFMMTAEKIQGEIERLGENSPKFWRFIRGFWPPETDEKTVLTENLLYKHDAFGSVEFSGSWVEIIAALDPAFTSDGDEAILRFAKVGEGVDGKIYIDLGGEKNIFSLKLDAKDTEPINYQIVNQTKEMCMKWGVKPKHLGVDTWGFGSGAGDIFEKMWSTQVHRVVSVGNPTDTYISSDMVDRARDQYDRRATELWFMIREFVQAGQIKGLDVKTAEELCTRNYEWKGRKISIESKELYKKRTGTYGQPLGSPDRADALSILIDVVRFQMGISPNSREYESEDDKRDWERVWERQMGFIRSAMDGGDRESMWDTDGIFDSEMFEEEKNI